MTKEMVQMIGNPKAFEEYKKSKLEEDIADAIEKVATNPEEAKDLESVLNNSFVKQGLLDKGFNTKLIIHFIRENMGAIKAYHESFINDKNRQQAFCWLAEKTARREVWNWNHPKGSEDEYLY